MAAELGAEVQVQTERGSRQFAAGDRIMFLRNERSLGVKNGSLGKIDSISAARMAVMLDDGRSVAFDLKDYDHLDHGYAATVHKAQGMTVDRVHVLATPGLDRHAAYVALSRHRDGVDLHYGRDDFAERSKLVRTLSRERAKDMASDYTRCFAERREIRLPSAMVRQAARAVEHDPFAGFGEAPAGKAPAPARDPFAGLILSIEKLRAPEQHTANKLSQAVQRFARATSDVMRLRDAGRKPLPHHMDAFRKAGAALDAVRPEARRDMTSVFHRDASLIAEAAKGRAANAIRQMVLETELRTDPARRAKRFVGDWRKLSRQREVHQFNVDDAGLRKTEAGMAAMGKQLQRDPQLESLLRPRARELGIEPGSGGSLSHSIQDWLDRSRQRGIGR